MKISKTVPTYQCYMTVGSVRGYDKDQMRIQECELRTAITFFQKRFEVENEYCCAVRIVSSEIVYQRYREPCFDIHCINYPRFPLKQKQIEKFMRELLLELMDVLEQERITLVTPDESVMFEREGADQSRVHEAESN